MARNGSLVVHHLPSLSGLVIIFFVITSLSFVLESIVFAQESPSPTAVEPGNSPYVYKLDSTSCEGGGSRSGTAFKVEGKAGLVTALHVVVECKHHSVLDPQTRKSFELKIEAVDIPHDAALLQAIEPAERIDGDSGFVPNEMINPNAPVILIGHPLGLLSQLDVRGNIFLRNAPHVQLSELIPANHPQLETFLLRKSPSADINVLSVNGVILHGFSGAPILYEDGTLVGMADGGIGDYLIEQKLIELQAIPPKALGIGAVSGISWGIAWKDIVFDPVVGGDSFDNLAKIPETNVLGSYFLEINDAREVGTLAKQLYDREADRVDEELFDALSDYFQTTTPDDEDVESTLLRFAAQFGFVEVLQAAYRLELSGLLEACSSLRRYIASVERLREAGSANPADIYNLIYFIRSSDLELRCVRQIAGPDFYGLQQSLTEFLN